MRYYPKTYKETSVEIYRSVLDGSRKRFPRNFWQENTSQNKTEAAVVVRYLIEEILKWDDETIKKQFNCNVLSTYKLYGMVSALYNGSAFMALDNAYPGRFHEWELSCSPRNYWNADTATKATRWLLEQKLKMNESEIKSCKSRSIFVENGFSAMLSIVYKNNAKKAIINAFPELF